jgi:hypothetical protein
METEAMNTQRRMLSLALAASLALAGSAALAATAAPAATAGHDHADFTAPAKLTFDQGRKWATDAPLRQRMGEIRALMAQKIPAIHAGKLSGAQYAALGLAVEERVGRIVAECNLPPEADAMLHLVVADLIAGADVMQGKAPGNPADGAHRVATAANEYGRYFDHKGWKPLG